MPKVRRMTFTALKKWYSQLTHAQRHSLAKYADTDVNTLREILLTGKRKITPRRAAALEISSEILSKKAGNHKVKRLYREQMNDVCASCPMAIERQRSLKEK